MQVVLEHLPFVSEQILACAFETRRVLVDGEPVEPSHPLSLGQTWEMIFHRHETEVHYTVVEVLVRDVGRRSLYNMMMQVLDTQVEILHVDEDLVVVNKPPSIPVHPIGRFRVSSVVM